MVTFNREQISDTIINDLVAAGVLLAGAESVRYLQLLEGYEYYDLMKVFFCAHELREIAIENGLCLPV